jgi:AraC-like DNA-binding protein
MSVPRFAATFRRRLGKPPYRYVCDLRVRRAQALLGQGHRAAVVAAETGFFDQSHMVRHFRRVCGATPRHFMGRA